MRRLSELLGFLALLLINVWALMALAIDLRPVAAVLYAVALAAVVYWQRKRPAVTIAAAAIGFFCVLAWWLTIKPSNVGDWNPDFANPAWADIEGDVVTIHNVRHCDYRTETDFTCQWSTRTVDLKNIQGLDLYMNYWGSPLIAHTILSFEVRGEEPVAFSIETRRKVGQTYSALLGFFRQFTLFEVVSDERDVVRVRTNFRHGEDLYLYHTTATPQFARSLFLNYIGMANGLRDHPQWYNAITHNCTTEIFTLEAMKSQPYDWRILINGKGDEMAYEKGLIATGDLPFKELKQKAYINPTAQAADNDPNFSALIRKGRPGF
jgi:hypothetical protein